jgi:cholesterol transport system auxiliary component
MIPIRLQWLLRVALIGFAAALCGCGQTATAERKFYVLNALREGAPAQVHTDATLRLRRFNVDEEFATRQIVYRVDEYRFETDYYHQFLVLPGVMLMEETRDWLMNSGLFGRVTAVGSRLESTYLLEANVIGLYADFSKDSAPTAITQVRFFLLSGSDENESVALAQTYKATTPISARTAEAVVDAFSRNLQEILKDLEADIGKVITSKGDKSPRGS